MTKRTVKAETILNSTIKRRVLAPEKINNKRKCIEHRKDRMEQAPKNETADFKTPQIGNHITNVRRENRHTTTTKKFFESQKFVYSISGKQMNFKKKRNSNRPKTVTPTNRLEN